MRHNGAAASLPTAIWTHWLKHAPCVISKPCFLQTMLLRRTKSSTIDGQPVVNLPARETGLVKKDFDEQERQFYKDLESESQEKVLVGV